MDFLSVDCADMYKHDPTQTDWASCLVGSAESILASGIPQTPNDWNAYVAAGYVCERVFSRFDLSSLAGKVLASGLVKGKGYSSGGAGGGVLGVHWYLYTGGYPYTVDDYSSFGSAWGSDEVFNVGAWADFSFALSPADLAAVQAKCGGFFDIVMRGIRDINGQAPLWLDPNTSVMAYIDTDNFTLELSECPQGHSPIVVVRSIPPISILV